MKERELSRENVKVLETEETSSKGSSGKHEFNKNQTAGPRGVPGENHTA